MCSHYEAPAAGQIERAFGVRMPEQGVLDLWPTYSGPFIRRTVDVDEEACASLEVLAGSFGLVPGWSKDIRIARRTYNARSETVVQKPSFRNAWRRAQHCIIPAQAIYEPDWRTGKAIATRITRKDAEPMGIAGLWECWTSPEGKTLFSYSMLTVSAHDHGFMRDYHRAEDEKRMVVILPRGLYGDWLNAGADESMAFMRRYPAERMVAG